MEKEEQLAKAEHDRLVKEELGRPI